MLLPVVGGTLWNRAGAQQEANLAVSLAKNSSLALSAAADLAGVLGQWDRSAALFRQALALDPPDADAHDLFSWTRYQAGRFSEAKAEARRLLEIRPSYATAHFDLGLCLLAQGKLREASKAMDASAPAHVRRNGTLIAGTRSISGSSPAHSNSGDR